MLVKVNSNPAKVGKVLIRISPQACLKDIKIIHPSKNLSLTAQELNKAKNKRSKDCDLSSIEKMITFT